MNDNLDIPSTVLTPNQSKSILVNQAFELEKLKIKTQSTIFYSLLAAVVFLSAGGFFVGLIRRPSDSSVTQLGQINLLLAGSLSSSLGFLLGSKTKPNEKEVITKKEIEDAI